MAIAPPHPFPAEWPDINKLIAERRQREAQQIAEFVAALLADRPRPAEARPTTTDCPSKDG